MLQDLKYVFHYESKPHFQKEESFVLKNKHFYKRLWDFERQHQKIQERMNIKAGIGKKS